MAIDQHTAKHRLKEINSLIAEHELAESDFKSALRAAGSDPGALALPLHPSSLMPGSMSHQEDAMRVRDRLTDAMGRLREFFIVEQERPDKLDWYPLARWGNGLGAVLSNRFYGFTSERIFQTLQMHKARLVREIKPLRCDNNIEDDQASEPAVVTLSLSSAKVPDAKETRSVRTQRASDKLIDSITLFQGNNPRLSRAEIVHILGVDPKTLNRLLAKIPVSVRTLQKVTASLPQ